jgi:hypothetical protein
LLDNFTNLVINYKIKYEIFISFIIKCFKTIIIIFEIIVSTFLVNIIVFILLLKKRNRLFKTTKNVFISKKRDRLSMIKTIINNKKNNNVKTLS